MQTLRAAALELASAVECAVPVPIVALPQFQDGDRHRAALVPVPDAAYASTYSARSNLKSTAAIIFATSFRTMLAPTIPGT